MSVFSLMRQFTIRFRMLGAIAVVLVLLGLLGGAGMWGMFRIHAMSDAFVTRSFAQETQIASLHAHLGSARSEQKEMLLQQSTPDALAAARTRALAALDAADQALARFLATPDAAEHLQALALRTQTAAFRAQLSAVPGPEADTAWTALQQGMAALDARLQSEVTKALQAQTTAREQTQWLFALLVVITILVVVPLTLLNMISICRPLAYAQKLARAIAGGDLSQTIRVSGKDEVADLERALHDMQSGLGALVAQVRDASGSLAIASQQIASGNQDLSARTEQTAGHAQDAVGTLSGLTATVQQTAGSSQTANQLARSASGTATRGGSVVQQAVASMQEISASSRKINDIIGLIDSIAFQTNILALNAAVEAARAGEQGRGFAVVASEVRSLAQRSAAAASEIKTLIGSSVQAVDGGVRHVEEAGAAMQEIVASVQRVGDIIGEISAAASEQTVGIAQANDSVGEIDRMTQQNAALVEESAAAADSLREQAARLAQVVQQFQLADTVAVRTASAPARVPATAPERKRLV